MALPFASQTSALTLRKRSSPAEAAPRPEKAKIARPSRTPPASAARPASASSSRATRATSRTSTATSASAREARRPATGIRPHRTPSATSRLADTTATARPCPHDFCAHNFASESRSSAGRPTGLGGGSFLSRSSCSLYSMAASWRRLYPLMILYRVPSLTSFLRNVCQTRPHSKRSKARQFLRTRIPYALRRLPPLKLVKMLSIYSLNFHLSLIRSPSMKRTKGAGIAGRLTQANSVQPRP